MVKVPNRLVAPLTAVPPVIPPVTIGNDQLYVVPAGTIPLVILTGVTVNAVPLHVIVVIAVIDATGSTLTVIEKILPVQLPDTGVTR